MHEIVTLQFGQQSNYVGTHFWNAQESYFTYGSEEESPVNHDIHFRPGIGADGAETYTPRAVIYDLKGAFGTLRRENALYGLQDANRDQGQGPWSGGTGVIREPSIPPSVYQQHLDQGLAPPPLSTADVRFWSDYNRVYYHPRSIVQLHDYELNSSLLPFERWETGQDLFSSLDREHDLLDRDLRPFLEECDQLQGLQIFTSTDDAWGGFTAKYLERMRDELGKTSVWVWALEEGGRRSRQKQMLQLGNSAQSLYQIATQASLYVPITTVPVFLPSYVSGFDPSSRWHTSALQVAAIESVTMPTRLRSRTPGLGLQLYGQMEAFLNNDGKRKIAHLGYSVGQPEAFDDTPNGNGVHDDRITTGSKWLVEEDELDSHVAQSDITMTPTNNLFGSRADRTSRGTRDTIFAQAQSLRGEWKSGLEIDDINLAARDRFAAGPKVQSCQTKLRFPVLDSFPCILHADVKPQTLAINASLTASSSVAKRIRSIEQAAASLIGIDEREALCDGLATLREEYEEGWEPSSDEDDQDL